MAFRHNIQHEEIIDGFKFSIIGEERLQEAVDFFFDVFLKDEPACGGRYKERPPQLVKEVKNLIRDGVSLMALDINNEDKMVGIRTAATVNRLAF